MIRMLTIATVAAALASTASAEVKSADAAGFVISTNQSTALTPAQAYDAAISLHRWWSSSHTYSGSAANLSLEAKPGGCWCEKLPAGGFVRHMSLEYAAPGQSLRFTGALGPLAGMGATGVLTISFAPAANGAQITATYSVNGRAKDGWEPIAAGVDRVLSEQIGRLAALSPP